MPPGSKTFSVLNRGLNVGDLGVSEELATHDDAHVREMLRTSAGGYLTKDQPFGQIDAALRKAARGDRVFTPEIARRLVLSSISTVGNYEYGSFWYFHQDGSIHFEMKATGTVINRSYHRSSLVDRRLTNRFLGTSRWTAGGKVTIRVPS